MYHLKYFPHKKHFFKVKDYQVMRQAETPFSKRSCLWVLGYLFWKNSVNFQESCYGGLLFWLCSRFYACKFIRKGLCHEFFPGKESKLFQNNYFSELLYVLVNLMRKVDNTRPISCHGWSLSLPNFQEA